MSCCGDLLWRGWKRRPRQWRDAQAQAAWIQSRILRSLLSIRTPVYHIYSVIRKRALAKGYIFVADSLLKIPGFRLFDMAIWYMVHYESKKRNEKWGYVRAVGNTNNTMQKRTRKRRCCQWYTQTDRWNRSRAWCRHWWCLGIWTTRVIPMPAPDICRIPKEWTCWSRTIFLSCHSHVQNRSSVLDFFSFDVCM